MKRTLGVPLKKKENNIPKAKLNIGSILTCEENAILISYL